MTTVAQVNAALKKAGAAHRLVRGRGYYYVTGDDASSWYQTGLYATHLNNRTLESVLQEIEALKEGKR